ncbi:hypothetical protein BDB00DRAFT_876669 [Zychaea mexicana]|uniref:uncharacterized protein n=1 Tax=Zychaea mexicana TaxID=64656 RepID=UPI0022FE100F|nr:uncharacterized protein BDB00DRAFT_876669 [Zychaea mexicana]KAI9489200.1 hypothetical protein BDB00DRAFT_876669 [Zychaea mexicana]
MNNLALTGKEIHETIDVAEGEDPYIDSNIPLFIFPDFDTDIYDPFHRTILNLDPNSQMAFPVDPIIDNQMDLGHMVQSQVLEGLEQARTRDIVT